MHDFLVVVEPLPEPAERELFMIRLSTQEVSLTTEEREVLTGALAAGYRRLLIFYSLPTPWREKFVDCSPLANGTTPEDFFRLKLTPLGITADQYGLRIIRVPYGDDEPFRTLAPEIGRLGVKTVTFSARQTEQRWFALLARRHFRGVRAHSFNPMAQRAAGDRHPWWTSHSGMERVASGYLKLVWAFLP